jgi:F-box and WD-40 domain protein 1/11/F-box/WD-40 domain protein 7
MKKGSRAFKDKLKGHKHAVVALHAPEGPEGSRLVSASADGMVRFWNISRRECENKFLISKPSTRAQLLCYLFRPQALYVGYDDSSLAAYDITTGAELFPLEGHEGAINALEANDATNVYSGSHDKTVRVWQANTGVCILLFQFSDPISVLRLTPSGSDLYVGTWDKVLRKVNLKTHQVQEVILASSEVIRAVLVTDTHVYVGGCDPVIRAWNQTTGEWKPFKGHVGWVLGLTLYRSWLFSFADDRTIRVWDIDTARCIEEFHGHEDAISAVAFVGDMLYSASLDHSVRTWDLKEMTLRVQERSGMMKEDVLSWKVYVYFKTIETRRNAKRKKGKKKKGKSKGKKGKGRRR